MLFDFYKFSGVNTSIPCYMNNFLGLQRPEKIMLSKWNLHCEFKSHKCTHHLSSLKLGYPLLWISTRLLIFTSIHWGDIIWTPRPCMASKAKLFFLFKCPSDAPVATPSRHKYIQLLFVLIEISTVGYLIRRDVNPARIHPSIFF